MAFKQEIVNIKDSSYVINPFLFIEGKKIEAQLIRYMSPFMEKILAIKEDESKSATEAETEFSKALVEALKETFTTHDIEEIVKFQCDVLAKVQKDGRTINLDTEFACEYDKCFELMKAVIMFNFKSVFQKLGIAAL